MGNKERDLSEQPLRVTPEKGNASAARAEANWAQCPQTESLPTVGKQVTEKEDKAQSSCKTDTNSKETAHGCTFHKTSLNSPKNLELVFILLKGKPTEAGKASFISDVTQVDLKLVSLL